MFLETLQALDKRTRQPTRVDMTPREIRWGKRALCLLVLSKQSKTQSCGLFLPFLFTYLAPLPPSIR